MKENVKYVGLDISTSIIGISFIDYKENLIFLDNINLKKNKDFFEKVDVVKNKLLLYKKNYIFDEHTIFSIEEAFQSFSKGFSSAKTLSQLNKFNGIVSYLVYETFNIKPLYINVNTARKNLQIKIEKKSSATTKEQVFSWVKEKLPDYDWPTKKLKSGPNKGLVKFDECCYDMSDAFVICKALIYNEKNNL